MGAEARLTELNLTLPNAPKPVATYLSAVRHGDLLYVSGHGPLNPDGTLHLGKVGAGLDLEAGNRAARQTGLAILWTLLSLGLMLVAHRGALRVSWLAGAGLLVVVVIKLVFVDLSKAEGWERIVTFIGVGVLMLVIGYFAPLPPRGKDEETPS